MTTSNYCFLHIDAYNVDRCRDLYAQVKKQSIVYFFHFPRTASMTLNDAIYAKYIRSEASTVMSNTDTLTYLDTTSAYNSDTSTYLINFSLNSSLINFHLLASQFLHEAKK